jgi:adenylate cyclase
VAARFRALDAAAPAGGPAESEALFVVESLPVAERAVEGRPPIAWDSRPTVAVLPFGAEAAESDAYFGDGMTEEIITALSVNRALFVIARNSTLRYRNSTRTPAEIAAELGVRYLLVGSIRRLQSRLRINAELVDAGANRIIWAERFDGADEDLFGFQSQIAASIAAAIDPRVQEAEMARVSGRPTASLGAYDSVLRGLSVLHTFRAADFELAGQMFRRAIELDPGYAQAHAHLAWWHNLRFGEGRSAEITEDVRQAELLSLRAMELDGRDAMVLAVSGHIQSVVKKRFAVAMGMFEQALAINPNSAIAWARSATTLAYMGEGEEALQRVRHAMRLSPFDPLSFAFCTTNGTAAIVAGRYDEAASWLGKARRLNPGYRAATRLLIAALALCGEREEAKELALEFMADEPNFRVSNFASWYPLCEPHLTRLLEGMRLGGLPD